MKTVKKAIAAGSMEREKKDGTKVVISWPANPELKVESLANKFPELPPFVIAGFDAQMLQHDASTAWRNSGGDMSKLPQEVDSNRKLWWDDENGVIRINWEFVPSESDDSRITALVASVKQFASLVSQADPNNAITPADAAARMGLSKADIKAVLARL